MASMHLIRFVEFSLLGLDTLLNGSTEAQPHGDSSGTY
jgi:hypothetical protein